MWRQFHGCPASGGGIERVFFSAGKQHDALKKRTMDKTLENTLKASINKLFLMRGKDHGNDYILVGSRFNQNRAIKS
jgi:hypothetical protein